VTWVAPREEPKPATQEMICIMRAQRKSWDEDGGRRPQKRAHWARCGAEVAVKRSMARGKVQSGQGKPAERGKAKGQSRAPLKVKYNIPGRELSA
jgi:hypothetical protein